MVTRKPVASGHMLPQPQSNATNIPPYPTSPVLPHDPLRRATEHADDSKERLSQRSRSSSASSANTWNSGFSNDDDDDDDHDDRNHKASLPTDIPAALQIGPRKKSNDQSNQLPSSLRAGPPGGLPYTSQQAGQQPDQSNPWASEELQGREASPPFLQSHNPHNPYLRMQQTGQNSFNSQAAWGEAAAAAHTPTPPPPPPPLTAPPAPPVELPTVRTPTDEMAGMTLDSQLSGMASSTHNLPLGLQPPLMPEKTGSGNATPRLERQYSGASSNPWQDDIDRERQKRQPDETPSFQPPQMNAPSPSPPPPPPLPASYPSLPLAQSPPPIPAPQQHIDTSLQAQSPYQSINLLDDEPPPHPSPAPVATEANPPKPPRPQPAEESPPRQPPRPGVIDTAPANPTPTRTASGNVPETPTSRARRQRNETYQIKQINWFDAAAGSGGRMRRSPIMTQNANGPCPLLALVNALTLSTPDHVQTALVDALRSREQVSLGLLLDAVFEELARRSEVNDKELPDVGDLYSFLITLHTGMNVNPRFVAPGTPHVGSVEAGGDSPSAKPGVFEETREMVLYSTFDIPLIHGWLPPPNSPIYAAFERSAKTFDEALNIQFREQELEEKLTADGLTPEEQQLYEDIALIKDFLEEYPTQLTEHGLGVMSRALRPGQIAILFRNDHFSTLYKDPRTGALTTLVTDAGYSSHDEIVWESLVDVSGAASELFSGDFRPVGNSTSAGPQAVPSASSNGASDGWQTVQPRDRGTRTATQTTGVVPSSTFAPPPGPPPGYSGSSASAASAAPQASGTHGKSTEQEDHDLALALQLQEEEEDNERREASARRRREDELSRQFLDREGHTTTRRTSSTASASNNPENRPPIPPRRSNLTSPDREQAPSPSVDAPYLRGQESPDDQPPSYEQAAADRPFRPPGSQPRNSGNRQGDALGALNAITAQQRAQQMNTGLAPQSAYAANSLSNMSVNSYGVHQTAGSMGHRRRSSAMGAGGGSTTNRTRRSQSQSVAGNPANGAQGAYGDRMGSGSYSGSMAQTAQGNRIAEQEKCLVM